MFEEISAHVGQITLNRPKSLNAFSKDLLNSLELSLEQAEQSKSLKVLVITGAGDKAFSAGADLKERSKFTNTDTRAFLKQINQVFDRVESFHLPTIAYINGFAFGGGLELALACDIRVAHPRAQMGLTECSLGIIPGAGGTQRLPAVVGHAKAAELIFSAKKLDASEALSMVLVNQISTDKLELAEQIAQNSRTSLLAAKLAMETGDEEGCYESIMSSSDRIEGMKAFIEKRKPVFE